MDATAKWLAIVGATLFTSWALYISVVEHPARMKAGAEVAVAQFRESYRRAAPWQASAAALSLIAGVLAAWSSGEWRWGLGGLAVGLAIPFTLLIIMPTNRRLLYEAPRGNDAMRLLTRWGRLHAVRTALGFVGLGALLWAAHVR